MSFNLPHKANVGEIIRVKGYESILYLVTEYTEERSYDKASVEDNVTYTCQNIDNYKDIKIVFDQDVASIVVTADKSDAFIKARQKAQGIQPMQPPALRKEDAQAKDGKMQIDLAAFARLFAEQQRKKQEQQPQTAQKKVRSPYEQARIKEKEDREYIDYLLDTYSMLQDLETMLGPDETRQEEMRMLKVEFEEKSAELYGLKKK